MKICNVCNTQIPDDALYCSFCGQKQGLGADSHLFEDIELSFHSISATHGHFGSSIRYIHSERIIVQESWGVYNDDSKPPFSDKKILKIPGFVMTLETLGKYIHENAHDMAYEIKMGENEFSKYLPD